MPAITPAIKPGVHANGITTRYSGTSTANQADTMTTTVCPERAAQKLLYVTVGYSAAPTQTGVTVELDSGAGANFDATLSTGAANTQDTVYIPDFEMWIVPGDAIRVSAPAGGGVITANVAIYMDQSGAY